jgi:glycosyltransferase involved in cell wall biosynthesis
LSEQHDPFIACPNDFPYYERYKSLVGESKLIVIPHRKFRLTTVAELLKFIKKNNIDMVHSMGKGAGLYSRVLSLLKPTKCVHTFHGLHIGEYNFIQKILYLSLEKLFTIVTDKFISVSKGECEKVIEAGICNNSKLQIIENGVEIPETVVPPENFSRDKFRLITFSRYDYQKYPELLVQIISELNSKNSEKEFVLDILGEGEKFQIVKKMIEEKKLQKYINQIGAVKNPQDYLLKSTCYISTSRWEGHPLSLIESMAVGLPVVASNVVGNNDIIENYLNGILFDLYDIGSAANAVYGLAKNYELWGGIANQARKDAIEKYSLEKMVKKTENLYVNILEK